MKRSSPFSKGKASPTSEEEDGTTIAITAGRRSGRLSGGSLPGLSSSSSSSSVPIFKSPWETLSTVGSARKRKRVLESEHAPSVATMTDTATAEARRLSIGKPDSSNKNNGDQSDAAEAWIEDESFEMNVMTDKDGTSELAPPTVARRAAAGTTVALKQRVSPHVSTSMASGRLSGGMRSPDDITASASRGRTSVKAGDTTCVSLGASAGNDSPVSRPGRASTSATKEHTPASQLLSQKSYTSLFLQQQQEEGASPSSSPPSVARGSTGATLSSIEKSAARRSVEFGRRNTSGRSSGSLMVEQSLFTGTTNHNDDDDNYAAAVDPSSKRRSSNSATAVLSSSRRRDSVEDSAVRAILEENPPTTTRPVQLKQGYAPPSPRSPLWPSLTDDGEEEGGYGDSVELWLHADENPRPGHVAGADNSMLLVVGAEDEEDEEGSLSPSRKERRLQSYSSAATTATRAALTRGLMGTRSMNLLGDEYSEEFSLTQEAMEQEGLAAGRDHHLVRRGRNGKKAAASKMPPRRVTATHGGAFRWGVANSPASTAAAAAFAGHGTLAELSAAMRAAATGSSSAASQSPTSQHTRAKMSEWAAEMRNFFAFIDQRPVLTVSVADALKQSTTSAKLASAAAAARRSAVLAGVASRRQSVAQAKAQSLKRTSTPISRASLVSVASPPPASAAAAQPSDRAGVQRATKPMESGSSGNSDFATMIARAKQQAVAASAARRSALDPRGW